MAFMKSVLPIQAFGAAGAASQLLKSSPSLLTAPHPSKPEVIPQTIIRDKPQTLINKPSVMY